MRRAIYRRSAVDKSVRRSVKMLIKMVASSLGPSRMALNEYHYRKKEGLPEAAE
jgi:hypothetical protein